MPLKPQQTNLANHSLNRSVWQTDVGELLGRKKTIPIKELAIFCRKLSFLFEANIQIESALSILKGQSLGSTLKNVLPNIHIRVLQGKSLSESIKISEVFPEFMYYYLSVGERTGQMAKVCLQLASYYEQEQQLREELQAAMLYPVIVTLMMLAVVIMAVTMVLPSYTRIFDASGVQLPLMTRVLLDMSNFMQRNVIIILVVVIVSIIFLFYTFHKQKMFVAWFKLQIPIYRLFVNLRLSQTLSILLSSGLNIAVAIPLSTEIMRNLRVQKDLHNLGIEIQKGQKFWQSLKEMPYIEKLFVEMAQVGEETGKLTHTIEKCHTYFESTYKHSIRRLNKLVEPMITLGMGIVLAFIMLAVVLPTFELATAV